MFATVGPGHIQEALYPVMGTLTPHVHGGWDSGTCLNWAEEETPYLGCSLGSVSNPCFVTLCMMFVFSQGLCFLLTSKVFC